MSAAFKHLDQSDLPADWSAEYFGNLVDFRLGKTPPRGKAVYWKQGKYPWVSISDMTQHGVVTDTAERVSQEAYDNIFRGKLVPEGSLLMSFKLTIGRMSRLGVPAFHNEAIISFKPDSNVISEDYLRYYLAQINYKDYQDTAIKGQTLNKGKLNELEIAFPPLPEQKKIAHALSTVRRAIETQERIIQATTELKKALMHELFTEGLGNEPQKQTEIGPIPESWEIAKVGEVAKIQSGGTPARNVPENWVGGTTPWVKTSEIDYCVIKDTEEKITRLGLNNSAAHLYPTGTLLMAMYGQGITRGRVGLLGIEAATNQACASITPTETKRISSVFLFYYFQCHYEDLRRLGHGANQRNMNAALIRSFPISFPEPDEQNSVVAALELLDTKIQFHERKRQQLQGIFHTLLHELMTAKARVHNIEIAIPH